MDREETARHFQHVVDVARLIGASIDALGQLVGRSEVFVFAVSAGGVAVMLTTRVPEELGG